MITSNDIPSTISQPAMRALTSKHISTLQQLAAYREKEIAALHGIGH